MEARSLAAMAIGEVVSAPLSSFRIILIGSTGLDGHARRVGLVSWPLASN